MTTRVLLVEDVPSFRVMIGNCLREQTYEVYEAWSVASARRLLPSVKPRFMLLDLGLEDGDGYALLKDTAGSEVATIVISARESADERVASLEMGAADYMVKPIDLRELMLRMKRLEKATPGLGGFVSSVDCGGFVFDLVKRTILRDGEEVPLSPSEFMLMRLFVESEGGVVARETISRDILGNEGAGGSRSADVLVSRLRLKLDPTGRKRTISSIRGVGYRFWGRAGEE